MKSTLAGVGFLFELVAFSSFAAIAFVFSLTTPLQWLLFVILFIGILIFWTIYMAPKAPHKFSIPVYYVVKMAFYSVSTFTLYQKQGMSIAIIFVVLGIVDEIALFNHNTAR